MPLHLDVICSKKDLKKVYLSSVRKQIKNPPDMIKDGLNYNIYLFYKLQKKKAKGLEGIKGYIVHKINVKDQTLELIDSSICLWKDYNKARIENIEVIDKTSYCRLLLNNNARVLAEDINSETVTNKKEKQIIRLTAFPIFLEIFDTLEDLNKKLGFEKMKETKYGKLSGLSDEFIADGRAFTSDENTTYTVLVGKVKEIEEFETTIGNKEFKFTIMYLDTGMGVLPFAVSRKVFDLQKLEVGKIVYTAADINVFFESLGPRGINIDKDSETYEIKLNMLYAAYSYVKTGFEKYEKEVLNTEIDGKEELKKQTEIVFEIKEKVFQAKYILDLCRELNKEKKYILVNNLISSFIKLLLVEVKSKTELDEKLSDGIPIDELYLNEETKKFMDKTVKTIKKQLELTFIEINK